MKILLSLFVPSITESYDVLVPDSLTVQEITPLIAQAVEQLSNRRYNSSTEEFLCFCENNVVLRGDSTLRDYGLRHGDHLMLI